MPLPRRHQHRHKPGQGDTLGATWHTGITTGGNFKASLEGTQWSLPAGVTRNFAHPWARNIRKGEVVGWERLSFIASLGRPGKVLKMQNDGG